MQVSSQDLAEMIGMLYYSEYDGDDDVESFISWLEDGCPETDDEDE